MLLSGIFAAHVAEGWNSLAHYQLCLDQGCFLLQEDRASASEDIILLPGLDGALLSLYRFWAQNGKEIRYHTHILWRVKTTPQLLSKLFTVVLIKYFNQGFIILHYHVPFFSCFPWSNHSRETSCFVCGCIFVHVCSMRHLHSLFCEPSMWPCDTCHSFWHPLDLIYYNCVQGKTYISNWLDCSTQKFNRQVMHSWLVYCVHTVCNLVFQSQYLRRAYFAAWICILVPYWPSGWCGCFYLLQMHRQCQAKLEGHTHQQH